MSQVIEVTNLSKRYLICHERKGAYSTIVSSLTHAAKRAIRSLKHPFSSQSQPHSLEEFWALKEVSFTCNEGDRIALIGKNGAGKSTFLKLLSRIIEPTSGKIKIKGKVASLLEVGTGFHPELTGRENIFLNGAILGMGKQEIIKKFDEIVNFSEIEQFLDTPVKYYSSGMYARLGFAIAAHLDPDILIVDEVLAVGDIQFQEKCLNKLDHVSKSGRTILFVSHNTSSLLTLCNKGVLFVNGQIKQAGAIELCVDEYLQGAKNNSFKWVGDLGDQAFRIFSLYFLHKREFFYQNESIHLKLECQILKPLEKALIGVEIKNQQHQVIAYSYLNLQPSILPYLLNPATYHFSLTVPLHYFWEGEYSVCFFYLNEQKQKVLSEEISLNFTVYKAIDTYYPLNIHPFSGILLPETWHFQQNAVVLPLQGDLTACLK